MTNPDYNYAEFTAGESGASAEFIQNSPKATSRAPAFPVEDLDTGEIISMQDLWKRETLIIEFGSYTWPFCSMAAPAMDALADRHADRAVRSVFIYVREAHPGENYRHLTSMEQKRDHARVLKKTLGLKRQILLDDLESSAHLAYGGLPNMTWIIGRGGIIQYKAAWTNVEDVEDALTKTLDAFDKRAKMSLLPFYSERACWREQDNEAFRAGLEKIGPQAVSDFFEKPRPIVPAGALDKGWGNDASLVGHVYFRGRLIAPEMIGVTNAGNFTSDRYKYYHKVWTMVGGAIEVWETPPASYVQPLI